MREEENHSNKRHHGACESGRLAFADSWVVRARGLKSISHVARSKAPHQVRVEHACHIEVDLSISHSVANVNITWLPKRTVLFVRTVYDPPVFGDPDGCFGPKLSRHKADRVISHVFRTERIQA